MRIPTSDFADKSKGLLCENGVIRMREIFGESVEIAPLLVKQAYLHFSGTDAADFLDRYVPALLKADHAAYVEAAKAEYRAACRQADADLIRSGDVAAYDQARALAFGRYRGRRYGALEGAFAPRPTPSC